eukprot:CAMPEP_0170572608 /NCGR_PEP_ID=MMETSP0224-20130122/2309_1 /TAXON_ID=285029 /ORGANISM="Togula jolla, Strain CCCM 725" /LENGTH=609 /DNA_ID=CAMNT_0010895113 /DNA_START=44 /DNA_END=1870 /DNA_ORIENTATION=-
MPAGVTWDDVELAGTRSGYQADDGSGHYHQVDEDLHRDVSERRPGGPVVEAIRSLSPQKWKQKWVVPVIAFLTALLIQSGAVYASTRRYVLRMEALSEKFPAADGEGSVATHYLLRDSFVLGSSGPSAWEGIVDLLAWLLPIVWAVVIFNATLLRVWTRTLITGTILALLKAVLAWATVLPATVGWDTCSKELNHWVLQKWDDIAVLQVVGLWLQDLLLGMRSQPLAVTCYHGGLSGPSYVAALCSLGLYEAVRTFAGKQLPHIRTMTQLVSAGLLTALVCADGALDVAARRQYTVDVLLALVFAMLVYSSPVVAVCTDRWMTLGCISIEEIKEGRDVGDVVVPPCCFPFCCMHGRYFLYTAPVGSSERARQEMKLEQRTQQATRVAEEFRTEQEETARRMLELEAQLDAVRQRASKHQQTAASEVERAAIEAIAQAREEHEARVAEGLAELEEAFQVKSMASAQANADEIFSFAQGYVEDTSTSSMEGAKPEPKQAAAASGAGSGPSGAVVQRASPEPSESVHSNREWPQQPPLAETYVADVQQASASSNAQAAVAGIASAAPGTGVAGQAPAAPGFGAASPAAAGDFRLATREFWTTLYGRFEPPGT